MARLQKPPARMWPALVFIVLVLLASLILRQCPRHTKPAPAAKKIEKTDVTAPANERGLIRHPSLLRYSRHARCRMKCRHIDETEVSEILAQGQINYHKSELNGAECENRYAVEGSTHDGQSVRVIFAPCNTEETVVTVIDLGREWPCDCK